MATPKDDRSLQTPNVAPGPATGAAGKSTLKLEDIPMSGRSSPRLTTPGASASGSRPTTGTSINTEKTREIQEKVTKATKTMEENVQLASQRGESLNELQDKSQAVATSSKQFSKNANIVKKNLWWKNMKFTLILIFVILCILGGIALLIYFQTK